MTEFMIRVLLETTTMVTMIELVILDWRQVACSTENISACSKNDSSIARKDIRFRITRLAVFEFYQFKMIVNELCSEI